MPNLDCSSAWAREKTDLKFRPTAGILVLTSVRRRGVREYSVERARRTNFFARLAVELEVEFIPDEAEASEAEEEERRRRWGGD